MFRGMRGECSRCFLLYLALLLLCSVLSAEEAVLVYVDGEVEADDGSDWIWMDIGDSVPLSVSVRLEDGTNAEFVLGDTTLTLTKGGTYRLDELFETSKRLSSWGLGTLVASKTRTLVGGRAQEGPEAVAGVRGASAETEVDWLGGEEAELVDAGRELLSDGDYEAAVFVFEEAFDISAEENEELILYYLGLAFALMGDRVQALDYLSEIDIVPSQIFYADAVLLKGQLLMETFALEEALELFAEYLENEPNGSSSQAVYYLAGLCYKSVDDHAASLQLLQKAIEADPDSEIAEIAATIMSTGE